MTKRWLTEERVAEIQASRKVTKLSAPEIRITKPQKYHAQPTDVDGIRFASKKEATRWNTLKLLRVAQKISNLERQVRYSLDVEGMHICDYIADFSYWDRAKECAVIEDVKGMRKGAAYDLFRLKAKLFHALFKIEVTEI